MRVFVVAAALLVGLTVFSQDAPAADSKPGGAADPRQTALEAVKTQLKGDPKNPVLLKQASTLAIELQDYPDALRFSQQLLAITPNDFGIRAVMPVLFNMLHDQPNFERATADLTQVWKDSSDPTIKGRKSFLLEGFKIDDYSVIARQCFEIGGRFGVKYLFLFGRPNEPVSKITLEVNYLEGLIDAEIKKTHDVYPAISMDAYSGGTHKTLMLTSPGPNNKEPDYNTMREKVVAYLKSPSAAISSQTMPGGRQFAVDCDYPPVTPDQQKVIDTHTR